MSELHEAIAVGLRKCRVEDGSPVALIRESDLYHISHMVAAEVQPLMGMGSRRDDARISTYGGSSTTQHWQLTYKGTFIMDTSAPHILAVMEEMRDKLNGVRPLGD